jgi:uncharacterized membrane protein
MAGRDKFVLIRLIFRATREQWQNPVTRIFFVIGPIVGILSSLLAFCRIIQTESFGAALIGFAGVGIFMWCLWSSLCGLLIGVLGIPTAYAAKAQRDNVVIYDSSDGRPGTKRS